MKLKTYMIALFFIPTEPITYEIPTSNDIVNVYDFYDDLDEPECECYCK